MSNSKGWPLSADYVHFRALCRQCEGANVFDRRRHLYRTARARFVHYLARAGARLQRERQGARDVSRTVTRGYSSPSRLQPIRVKGPVTQIMSGCLSGKHCGPDEERQENGQRYRRSDRPHGGRPPAKVYCATRRACHHFPRSVESRHDSLGQLVVANCRWPKPGGHDDRLAQVAAERGLGQLLTCRPCHPCTGPGRFESGSDNSTGPSGAALRTLKRYTTTAGSPPRAGTASGNRCASARRSCD